MARINTNIASLVAQSNLSRAYADLDVRMERLATGLRINRGADDPAGLITSERLRSEISGIGEAIDNSQRATSVIATTEGALVEVAELLTGIRGLIVKASNTGGRSPEELEAQQLEIDSAIESITRISNTANFAGLSLLNGSLDYVTSGVSTANVAQARIFGVHFGENDYVPVNAQILASAQTGEIRLNANYAGTANDGTLLSSVTLEIAGNEGVQVLQFISGTQMDRVVDAVNLIKDSTGVSAVLVSSTNFSSGVIFSSVAYGSSQFVSVKKLGNSGQFFTSQLQGGIDRDEGQDVRGLVNGALATGDGLTLAVKTPMLSLELDLTTTFAQQTSTTETFYVTGGGAMFQLGPEVKSNQQINFGIRSIAASRLGGTQVSGEVQFLNSLMSGGVNSINSGNFEASSAILERAIDDISVLRGELGAIEQNTLQTNVRSLQVALENLTSSNSKIRDADFARETAEMTRSQIMVQSGTTVLALANANAQNVLQLLG